MNAQTTQSSDSWPFVRDLMASLGDRDILSNVLVAGGLLVTSAHFAILPPGAGGQVGAVTVRGFFLFRGNTQDAFYIDVHDFGDHWTAEFGGFMVDSRQVTLSSLKVLMRNLFEHILMAPLTTEQFGRAVMMLGALISTAAQHLADAQAK